jgi:hypothetical protein
MGKASRRKRDRTARYAPMQPELHSAIKKQLQAFRDKFGREPGPNDLLFFDPDCDQPTPIDPDKYWAKVLRLMGDVGIEPAKIYASKKTGLLPTSENWHLLSQRDRDDWDAAIEEYETTIAQNKKN